MIVGLQTAVGPLGLAIWNPETQLCVGSITLPDEKGVGEELAIHIETLLTRFSLDWTHVTGIAVTIGPGRYTNLRLGTTVANTLHQVKGMPVYGVQTADALVSPLANTNQMAYTLLPGRTGEVIAKLYQLRNGLFQAASENVVWKKDTVADRIGHRDSVIVVGPSLPESLQATSNIDCITTYPLAETVAQLATTMPPHTPKHPKASPYLKPEYGFPAV
ncbi:tRNA (adenosine(37)-N6)-threonylcarbamoyltransferase complex dimerization subunit type 1 TsaB [bacterium]|jgi:tRNA threonylcarbamoyladenosine biosynthesis protein TsaB|nr:tRNA (adenosine(37)-N6)-threonylcarbamoyltransferase complex dimerization subunit type 1 TsaB [bacterium]